MFNDQLLLERGFRKVTNDAKGRMWFVAPDGRILEPDAAIQAAGLRATIQASGSNVAIQVEPPLPPSFVDQEAAPILSDQQDKKDWEGLRRLAFASLAACGFRRVEGKGGVWQLIGRPAISTREAIEVATSSLEGMSPMGTALTHAAEEEEDLEAKERDFAKLE